MFTSAVMYRIAESFSFPDIATIETELQKYQFTPCGLTQELSTGWTPPRDQEHGALLESVGGQWIVKLMTETKKVPGDVLRRSAAEKCTQIEQLTGRKPGKKETKEIKEDLLLELLPMAFASRGTCVVWIDPVNRLLVVDSASQSRADMVLTAISKVFEGMALTRLQTNESPTACMAAWLTEQEPPVGFSIDRECELQAADESKAVVRYANHALDIEEVKQHIAAGKIPVRLAMTWEGRISFLLTHDLILRKLVFVEGVFNEQAESKDDRFDANAAILTGELSKMLPDVIAALGGEMAIGQSPVTTVPTYAGAAEGVSTEAGLTPSEFTGDAVNDPLYDAAWKLVNEQKKASISLVQRHLRIGYNRAARLIEQMEVEGKVSPMNSAGSRTVQAA